jgi:hypothetical protein
MCLGVGGEAGAIVAESKSKSIAAAKVDMQVMKIESTEEGIVRNKQARGGGGEGDRMDCDTKRVARWPRIQWGRLMERN